MSAVADMPLIVAAPMRGPATYFNGLTSKRHDVIIETTANSLRIINNDQTYLVDEWSYAELRGVRRRPAPCGSAAAGRWRWRVLWCTMRRLPPPSRSAHRHLIAAVQPIEGCGAAWSP